MGNKSEMKMRIEPDKIWSPFQCSTTTYILSLVSLVQVSGLVVYGTSQSHYATQVIKTLKYLSLVYFTVDKITLNALQFYVYRGYDWTKSGTVQYRKEESAR